MITRVRAWLAERGADTEPAEQFLNKSLPRNVGWIHTLGSLLLFYILFQMLTGVLLGFYYTPSPEGAYRSVSYIDRELLLGGFLLRLHRYGAGFVMTTAFLHLLRTFLLGSYKAPRELLWISGVSLGLLLTLFAFTGQLLPYDQRGYWATVVGIHIASSAPGLGDAVGRVLTGGYGDIGAATLSRFYVLHICVLPIVMLGLVRLHLRILQKVGSSGPVAGSPEPHSPFFPRQALRDVAVAAGGALLLCLVAALLHPENTGPANPAPGSFVPRPEWYFGSHYQLLKVLPGVIGAFVLPNVIIVVVLMLPFLDRGPGRSFRQRRIVLSIGGGLVLLAITLTLWGVATAPAAAASTEADGGDPVTRGRQVFHRLECAQCHRIAGEGGEQGPDLTSVATRLQPDYLKDWIRNPAGFRPATEMPAFAGTEEELEAVVAYLLTQK